MPTYQIISERRSKYSVKISSPKDALPVLDRYRKSNRESFICISLNGAHESIATRIVSVGLVNKTVVHAREVFADPIVDRAVAVLVAHNHPSGDPTPSSEDIKITRQLVSAGQIMGIKILDHMILGSSEPGLFQPYISLREAGLVVFD